VEAALFTNVIQRAAIECARLKRVCTLVAADMLSEHHLGEHLLEPAGLRSPIVSERCGHELDK